MGKIELKGVEKTFGNVHVIQGVDLVVEDGAFVVFVGPSGCGKSTLLRLIAGLLPVSGGTLEIAGGSPREHLDAIGIVFQAPVLLDWRDVLGNVLFQVEMRGLDRRRFADKARRLLDQVGLVEFMHAVNVVTFARWALASRAPAPKEQLVLLERLHFGGLSGGGPPR